MESAPELFPWKCCADKLLAVVQNLAKALIRLRCPDFKASVDLLAQHFPRSVTPLLHLAPAPPPQFHLPSPDPGNLGRVQNYLVQQRKIAPVLLEPINVNNMATARRIHRRD
jgi:hypothetical protein